MTHDMGYYTSSCLSMTSSIHGVQSELKQSSVPSLSKITAPVFLSLLRCFRERRACADCSEDCSMYGSDSRTLSTMTSACCDNSRRFPVPLKTPIFKPTPAIEKQQLSVTLQLKKYLKYFWKKLYCAYLQWILKTYNITDQHLSP